MELSLEYGLKLFKHDVNSLHIIVTSAWDKD